MRMAEGAKKKKTHLGAMAAADEGAGGVAGEE
jgi:hypothetical protein